MESVCAIGLQFGVVDSVVRTAVMSALCLLSWLCEVWFDPRAGLRLSDEPAADRKSAFRAA